MVKKPETRGKTSAEHYEKLNNWKYYLSLLPQNSRPISYNDIKQSWRLCNSMTSRILRGLEAAGYVSTDDDGKTYRRTQRAVEQFDRDRVILFIKRLSDIYYTRYGGRYGVRFMDIVRFSDLDYVQVAGIITELVTSGRIVRAPDNGWLYSRNQHSGVSSVVHPVRYDSTQS